VKAVEKGDVTDRTTELQADNTKLITELRMVRAQLDAAKALMRVGFIERPMSRLMPASGSSCEDLVKLYERIELLEKDGWTQTGPLARQFVKAVKAFVENESGISQKEEDFVDFIESWADKFHTLVGD